MNRRSFIVALCLFLGTTLASRSANGNRLTYLDSDDPFYVGRDFPRLTTPQWVGEPGVDAIVVLSIDDMRDTPKYETVLRPILERLKKIDGRAPVSIMVNNIPSTNAQLQSWLSEGVSLECHTLAHPCPLCQKGDFNAAAQTYHGCVDIMNAIPGNRPLAFRMPCCDSMNSPTPRFYAEIFNRTSPGGNFLTIDSSVMVLLTTNDSSLPRELVMEEDGRERFRKYLPTQTNATTRVSMGSFTTTIEDYPFPYVINRVCWEFPCIVPSDWEANNLHRPNNPKTVEDWKRALDAIVRKQGVMTFIFHPHGWIKPEQMVEFIDYAVSTYGRRVKFLNFREAQERLNKNLLAGQPLRRSDGGGDNGVRLLDIDSDGYLDVIAAGSSKPVTRLWNSAQRRWNEIGFPVPLASAQEPVDSHFGIIEPHGRPVVRIASAANNRRETRVYEFDGEQWKESSALADISKELRSARLFTNALAHRDDGWRFRDIDHDGIDEVIIGAPQFSAIYRRDGQSWKKLDYALPEGTSIVDEQGRDAGLRFVDVDGDSFGDVLFSNGERFSLHLFRKDSRNLRLKPGWSDEILAEKRADPLKDVIPPIVRDGAHRNNGVWFKNGTMWIQNENTAHLPAQVDRRTFKQLLAGDQPPPLSPEESLRAMSVRPGFRVELMAAEPLIADPVAFEWSADGKLWVVEMGDYPSGLDGKGKSGGRVRILEDRDGDGGYDHATSFLEGVNFPNGIYPWRKGVVISAAPEIFYAEDSDGDGKADRRETLFTGFVEGNQQHRVNGFDYGLDGWLYAANGDSGGNVRPAGFNAAAAKPVALRGQDLRIHPDKRLVENIAGQTQFGRHRDDWGHWFGNNNPTWLWHYFFPEHYLTRNPLLPLKTTKKILANYENSTRCFPTSRTVSRFNDPFAANHVTSANSAAPYRDNLFGADFSTSVFISEPVHNLIHREVLEPAGVSFTSHRAPEEKDREFLASRDNWFRPTMMKTGPDGALWIADMYRLVIEHPEWIPAEMQKRYDLRAGTDKGRIYRVYPEGAPLRKVTRLDKLDTPALIAAMDSPNGWVRDTAQRLLSERDWTPFLPQVARSAVRATNAATRVQALHLMANAGVLPSGTVIAALQDPDARVREHAVAVSESLLQRDLPATRHVVETGDSKSLLEEIYATPYPVIAKANALLTDQLRVGQALLIPPQPDRFLGAILSRVADPASPVRYQLAFTLGEATNALVVDALVRLTHDTDEDVRNAALTSAPRHAPAMLALMKANASGQPAPAVLAMLQKLVANPIKPKPADIVERTRTISPEQRAERARVVARYDAVAKRKGDAKSGATLFQQQCAQCHRLKGSGTEVGPDLGMMRGKPVEQLVESILDPNAAMESRYQNFSVVLKDGGETSGIIVAETPTTLTLRAPNRADETLLRADVKELTASGLSLMPEGLETAFTPQQLADVIAFVTE